MCFQSLPIFKRQKEASMTLPYSLPLALVKKLKREGFENSLYFLEKIAPFPTSKTKLFSFSLTFIADKIVNVFSCLKKKI